MIFSANSGIGGPSIAFPSEIRRPFPLPSTSISISISISNTGNRSIRSLSFTPCLAASKQQTRPPKKKSAKKKAIVSEPFDEVEPPNHPLSLPKPPAGFILDAHGAVLAAASKRLVTVVDSVNNLPLECVVRRVFQSSGGDDCMLLCPVDMPIQILKSSNFEGWETISDEEAKAIVPAAAYALAKIHMHLIQSGFCYTARGGCCYSEEDILEFQTDDGQDIDGLPSEGIAITCFQQDGSYFMIFTPSDPLLFVAIKDEDGILRIADDDVLEDPAIIDAVDEETEFNALAEEELALLESLLGVGATT